MPAVIAIDQGTTGSKAYRLDTSGAFEALGGFEHRQIFPQPGWVEHDANELLDHVRQLAALAGDAQGLGIDNQGETVVAWDGESGEPIYNAIVWQDARSQETIERLKAEGTEPLTVERAGLPLDPYFSASKLRWILDHVPAAKPLLAKGRLRLGTTDSFFLDRLAGVYATDVTTASRTSLMNLKTGQWDPELCRLFGVPMDCLAEIRPTVCDFGSAGRLPIRANVCDQQAALFGHGCRRGGQAKITFGTGAFALAVADHDIAPEAVKGMNRTVAWQIGSEPMTYAVEGGIYNAASAVNWARGLGLFSEFSDIDSFAAAPAIERGLVFVPALSGLAAPDWDRNAAGLWLGMGLETTRADMMQSLLEGVALLATQLIVGMERATPLSGALSVDGGLARNPYFCDFLADALERPVNVPASAELTGLGAAQLALIGAGLATIDSLPRAAAPQRVAQPKGQLSKTGRARFIEALARCRNWR
jgi:glycerol kinase